jgi:hypothetical protein
MHKSATNVVAWRCLIVMLALVAAVQLGIETFHAPRELSLGVRGERLFEGSFLRERGPTTFLVDALPPGSPLAAAGVVPGDRLHWEKPIGRWYNVAAGERAAVTVLHGETRRAIEFTMPAARELPRHHLANYVLGWVTSLFGLLLGVMLGWRRADLTAFRGLSAAALLATIQFPYAAPASAHIEWLDFVSSVSHELPFAALVFFAINYPDDRPSGWRAVLKRYYPWIFGLQVVAVVLYYAQLYSGSFEPSTRWIFRSYEIALPALFLVTMMATWRQARGETKIRLQWILATLGVMAGAILLAMTNRLAGTVIPAPDVDLILNVITFAAMLGLAYAIVRKRIFDFGLAVNRTLVIAIVGAILLGIFQVAHALVGRYLQFDDRNQALALSAVLAIAIYLSFTYLKQYVEKFVDRVFFSSWAAREQDLKRFVKEAGHATDAEALGSLLIAAIDRFTQNAGCATYRRVDRADWLRTEATLLEVGERLDANNAVVLALAAHDKALRIRLDTLPAAWAFPMSQRGKLVGFAVIGPLRNGDPYRADQIEALESALHQVGFDFYALRIERIERELADERANVEILRAQLSTATMMAMRIAT